MKLVTLKAVFNTMEAHVLRTKLESEGIPCALFDEHMIGLYHFYDAIFGGIKIKVREQDYERACEIIGKTSEQKTTE